MMRQWFVLRAKLKLLPSMQIVLWTSGIVVLSLLINAPLTPVLLRWTGLTDISGIKVWVCRLNSGDKCG